MGKIEVIKGDITRQDETMRKISRFLTARQAKELDSRLRREFGISTLILMENAGRAVAEEALRIAKDKARIAIFCGRGNNGADGFVAARHIIARGVKPQVFLAGDVAGVRDEARENLDILLRLGQKVIEVGVENLGGIKGGVLKGNLIIDALLGVGLEGEVRGIFKDLINLINSCGAYVLSVDIPSGLDATQGKILGCCVKADETVTFIAAKKGMFAGDGPKVCGRVVVRDLGI